MKNIKLKDLKPCDVILCRGEGTFSDMIVLLDGGTYSHSALYVGQEDGKHYVFEATDRGIVKDPIEKLKEETFVDVYRFNKDGNVIQDEGYPAKPIIDIGQYYVDNGVKYAFDHIILLGLLCITRDIPMDSFSSKLMRIILDNAADLIFKYLDKGIKPMVCSELVYRCFDEADPDGKYKIRLNNIFLSNSISNMEQRVEEDNNHEKNELDISKERFISAYERYTGAKNTGVKIPDSCVSPKDLENSKDLEFIGRLVFE